MPFFKKMIFPPKCVGCGELFDIFDGSPDLVLCERCMNHWLAAKSQRCRECNVSIGLCRCIPKPMLRSGVCDFIKAVPYDVNNRSSVQDRFIYRMKHKRDERAACFAAEQLCDELLRRLAENNCKLENTVITYVPRIRKSITENGVDQSECIASSIGKVLKIPCLNLIERSRGGREQKKLTLRERKENVRNAFKISNEVRLDGRTVLLFDDVVTTGSSMARCAELLFSVGAEKVISVAVGKTNRKNVQTR